MTHAVLISSASRRVGLLECMREALKGTGRIGIMDCSRSAPAAHLVDSASLFKPLPSGLRKFVCKFTLDIYHP
jgi:hypothetical protein